jgi:death-on-curing protein
LRSGGRASPGQYLHEDLAAMAAAYLYHIAQNHPFEDANKRTAAHAAMAFLRLNDIRPPFTDDDLVDLTLAVASGG